MISRIRAAQSSIAGRCEDPQLVMLPLAMQLDQDGRRAIAAAQARDALDLDPRLAAELACDHLETQQALGRAPQMAGLVAADVHLDIRRRLQPEMGEEADDLVQPVCSGTPRRSERSLISSGGRYP